MLVPYAHMPPDKNAPPEEDIVRKPRLHHASVAFREGEFVLTKDAMEAPDWYLAEITEVLPDRVKVNYYTTVTPPLESYSTQTDAAIKLRRLGETSFLRTWCLQVEGRRPTTVPPSNNSLHKDLYSGQIPLTEIHQHILARDVQLTAHGILDPFSIKIALKISLPHHEGAGGEDDFL